MGPRERPVGLRLVEHARARPDEVLVEHSLVEAALPPFPVERVERVPARLHAQEAVPILHAQPRVHEPLKGIARLYLGHRGPGAVNLQLVKRFIEGGVRQAIRHATAFGLPFFVLVIPETYFIFFWWSSPRVIRSRHGGRGQQIVLPSPVQGGQAKARGAGPE